MNIKAISKKDELLKQIYYHEEVSSEAIDALDGTYYSEKLKAKLVKDGFLKKAVVKNTNKTALKRGVCFSIQSYYVTAKGKKYLKEKFPEEFRGKIFKTRKQSNEAIERLVKISDSAIMSEIAGACIPPNYDVDTIMDNITHGVFVTPAEAKKNLSLTKEDVSHYKFTAITGVLLTPTKPYYLYSAGNGFISQTAGGEEKIANHLSISFARDYSLYPDALTDRITNAIIFCKNISAFVKLVLNKYNTKVKPGEIFDNSYIIPVSRYGCNIIKRFIEKPEYKNKLIDYLISEYGFSKNQGYAGKPGYAVNALPVVNPNGEAVFIGIDFEVNSFRTAIEIATEDKESKLQRIVVLCFTWQQDYYDEVIRQLGTDKIICQPIDEEALDEILGFENRIQTVKPRARRERN